MATTIDVTKELQEKVLSSIKIGQKAALESARSWAATTETFFSRLPELATADPTAKPGEYIQAMTSFGEQVLTSQREFMANLFEAFVPATKAAASAPSKAARA